ncbi:phosphate acyltransferase PlsX [Edaphobacillus lindanitolerans]|uniref:Phosphate acyltransferase n=1 Tax=Edaphobacillus lindanitolerans TaxID=550447 RepID=A0A1U7PL17_9BACI|nr:phosphate acyltransferase PlsX [Edaphobacillus lindanitolerans]SIT67526.1 phosphate:acyl-[acyl carrier protein] acyltransferase [Edaphobacillus lindanitolerans]
MIIAVDAMGGDNAPDAVVDGVKAALAEFPDIRIRLYGDREAIESQIGGHERLSVIHCSEKIDSEDEPVRAVRRKKDASMVRMAQSVRDGESDAGVSAGNTGALMASGLFIVGRMDGVDRPALAPTLPTVDGSGFLMLDMGANADAKPQHLAQYAVMGSVYAEQVRNIRSPRVGLLNIGTEENKGNELTKEAFGLIGQAPVNFIGNVEARDLLNGVADVVVTDGFTGNMVLKTIEGTAQGLMHMMKEAFMSTAKGKIAGLLAKDNLGGFKKKMDYTEYGGAGLFGLKAPLIKAHGSSNANAIKNAIRQARTMAENDVAGRIGETIGRMGEHE